MKAILLTRCGCSKELEIPAPPNPKILIPLRRGEPGLWWDIIGDDITQPSFGTRTFVLYQDMGNRAEYLEAE